MEERTQIVIDIQVNEAGVAQRLSSVNSEMEQLKASNKELRNEIKAGNDVMGENSKKLAENEAKLKSLQAEQKALSGQVAQATQKSREYGTSLKEQAAKLNDLRNRYQSLDETQRNSKGGQKMLKEIKELDKAMKEADAQQGIFGRNVGDYANKMAEAFDKAGVSVKGLKGKFDLLNKNPIMFVIGVLVGLLMKLRDRMQQSEKVTASLSNATKTLSPIMEGVSKVVEKLADIFSNVLNWAIEKTIQAIGWLGKTLQKVGSWFGKDWGGGLTEMAEAMEQLRNSSNETTETIEEQTAAIKENVNAIREALDTINAYAYDKALEEAAKRNNNLADSIQKVADRVGLLKEEFDKLDPSALDGIFGEVTDENLKDTTTQWELFAEAVKNNAKYIEATVSSLSSSFGSLSSMYKQMAQDEEKTEKQREQAAKNAKRWADLQIAANAGTAVAKGIEGAMSAPTVPAKIASLAAIMAAVLSAVSQAKALAAEGHEQGGVIGGRFTGATMGSDNTYIHARRGEMVLNANQQRQLFEIANSGTSPSLAAQLAEALQAMPAPVLEYSEFTRFTGKVANITELQKLR